MKNQGRKVIEQWVKEGVDRSEIIFYCDMDGVVANFKKGAEILKLTSNEFKMVPEAYRNLEPYEHAFKILDAIEEQLHIKVEMLTKIPDANPYAATEKLLWLLEHEPKRACKTTITHDKGNHGTEHSFLLDDRIHKANIQAFRGVILHFGEYGIFKEWKSIVDYFGLDYQF